MNLAELNVSIELSRKKMKNDLKLATNELRASQKKMQGSIDKLHTKKLKKELNQTQGIMNKFNLKNFMIGTFGITASIALVKKMGGAFIGASSITEQYKVRLDALLGSQREGARLFKNMADLAGQVPQTYEEIMGGATQLAGIMRGGVDEITTWMPMIADLAAVTGVGVQETVGQVIRMYSAGAQSADMFRERGILAMMGFRAGVHYTVEDTRRMMFESWNKADSQFKGATDDLALTWDGTMGMMNDKWFQFRNLIMDTGPFEALKGMMHEVDTTFGKVIDSMEAKVEKLKNIEFLKKQDILPMLPRMIPGTMGIGAEIMPDYSARQLAGAAHERVLIETRKDAAATRKKIDDALFWGPEEDPEKKRMRINRENAERHQQQILAQGARIQTMSPYYHNFAQAPTPDFSLVNKSHVSGLGRTWGKSTYSLGFQTGTPSLTRPESQESKDFLMGAPNDVPQVQRMPTFKDEFGQELGYQYANTLTRMVSLTQESAVTIENVFQNMGINIINSFTSTVVNRMTENLVESTIDAISEYIPRGGELLGVK